MAFLPDIPREEESSHIRWDVIPYTHGTVLDVGGVKEKLYPQFLGIGVEDDTTLPTGARIKPDVLIESYERLSNAIQPESCDSIFSSYVLNRVDYKAALQDWWSCIKPEGYLVLYLPHKAFYARSELLEKYPDHLHDIEPVDITNALREVEGGWDLVAQEVRTEDKEHSFFQVFQKRTDSAKRFSHLKAKKTKRTACVVRYGGIGDMLQVANVLPALRRQGFKLILMTTPEGKNLLREDPNVDEWIIQEHNQVPNNWLGEYWSHVSKKFDRFVNLCESVEGTLLAMPGRANYLWPFNVRHAKMNDNYFEFMAALAQVPTLQEGCFYPTDEEYANARARLTPDGPNFVWALSGSAIHKFYPGQDKVIQQILEEYPTSRVFFTGDEVSKLLEIGWEKDPRVVCLSGELSIRDSLTLARVSDCVIGCETGVLNSVAFLPNRKVVLLSHSSVENLTKNWINTASIVPTVRCYPCHRLHYVRDYCPEDKATGAAECQASIPPQNVFAALDVFREKGIK